MAIDTSSLLQAAGSPGTVSGLPAGTSPLLQTAILGGSKVRLTDEERKARSCERTKKWAAANPERAKESIKQSKAKWRAANLELARERDRLRAARNSEYNKKYRAENHERRMENKRKWRKANPERAKLESKKAKCKTYGVTVVEYDALVAAQGHKCAVCGTDHPGRKKGDWLIDHCHETKAVRGLLCHNCNCGLGHFRDSVAVLQRAIDYLNSSLRS
jgi:hypothetical protein